MPITSTEYDKYFKKYGEQFNVDPLLLKSIAYQESKYNQDAKGDYQKGIPTSFGLMQINKKTFDFINQLKGLRFKLKDLFNPTVNIMYGARILRAKINKYKDIKRGIIGYNGHRGRFTLRGVYYYNKVKKNYQRLTGKDLGNVLPFEDTALLASAGIAMLFLFTRKRLG